MSSMPLLKTPPNSETWAMISNHPYYPSIEFFLSEDDARGAAIKEIEDMHNEEGRHDESSVLVVRVEAKASIKTFY